MISRVKTFDSNPSLNFLFKEIINTISSPLISFLNPIIAAELIFLSSSKKLFEKGLYVVGFFYPVVPKGQARIRVQISAAMSMNDIEKAVNAFEEVGKSLNII